MPALHDHWQPNSDEVVSKVMDGEAIIIRLSDGIYYSMDQVGGAVWELIEETRSLHEIVTAVSGRYEVDVARAQADIERLIDELSRERLIAVATDAAAPHDHGPPHDHAAPHDQVAPLGGTAASVAGAAGPRDGGGGPSSPRQPYEPPRLNIYRDMGDLLALDPPAPGLKDIPWKKLSDEPPS